MIDVILGLAVEGVKNLMHTEIGHNALHVAAHKAGHAIEKALGDDTPKHPSPQLRPGITRCRNCGATFPKTVNRCWNCHTENQGG